MLAEIIKGEDAVLLRTLAMKEREIVMDQVMEVAMMAMKDVKEILSVVAIIVNSLVCTTTIRMIAVSSQLRFNLLILKNQQVKYQFELSCFRPVALLNSCKLLEVFVIFAFRPCPLSVTACGP